MDVTKIRADFPILSRTVRDGKPLVYLDSGATSQRPRQVLDAERAFLEQHNAAVHRGAHQLAEEATDAYEAARARIAAFVGARARRGGVHQERHRGRQPRRLRVRQRGHVRRRGASGSCSGRATRSSSPSWSTTPTSCRGRSCAAAPGPRCAGTPSPTTAGSTSTRSRSPSAPRSWRSPTSPTCSARCCRWRSWCARAQRGRRAHVCSTPASRCRTCRCDFGDLGVDFAVFSGHKMLGPSGVGVLYGRSELLAAMPPFLTGGSMIEMVRMEGSTYAPPPQRFEAGVPMTSQAVGLGAAVDYLTEIGMDAVHEHEMELVERALDRAGGGAGRARHRADDRSSRGRGRRVRRRRDPRRTTSARCSTTAVSRCGWATTARGRCTGGSE